MTTTDTSLTNDSLTFNEDAAILYKNWERKEMSTQEKKSGEEVVKMLGSVL